MINAEIKVLLPYILILVSIRQFETALAYHYTDVRLLHLLIQAETEAMCDWLHLQAESLAMTSKQTNSVALSLTEVLGSPSMLPHF